MIYKFKAKKEVLSRINDVKKDNSKYYKCQFYLDKETWSNSEIFVYFKNYVGYSKIIPLGKYAEVLSCTLPKQMISQPSFKLYIYSKDELKTNEVQIIPSEICKTKIKHDSALNQIVEEINKKIDNIYFEDNQLKCYSNNTLIDTIYIDNVDEAVVQQQIDLHFQKLNPKIDNIIFIDDNIICYADNEIVCTIPLLLSDVAWSGDYNDLNNIPETFNPSQHTHQMVDVTDYEDNVSMDLNILLDLLNDEIRKE